MKLSFIFLATSSDVCVRGSRETVRLKNWSDDYKIDLTEEAKELLRKMIASDKKVDFLDALQVFSGMLDSVTLPESSVDFKQACKDVLREHVVLNGVSFVGEGEAKVVMRAYLKSDGLCVCKV